METARLELRVPSGLRAEIHARIPFGLRHLVAIKFYEALLADIRSRGAATPITEVLDGVWTMKKKE
jgi:hypothetical protein